MTTTDYNRLARQLAVLREVAEDYRGRTLENIIQNIEARLDKVRPRDYAIGEVFDYKGLRLLCVEDDGGDCDGCYFDSLCTTCTYMETPWYCSAEKRKDGKNVKFVKEGDQQ